MKKISLANRRLMATTILIVLLLTNSIVGVVSGAEIYNREYREYLDTSGYMKVATSQGSIVEYANHNTLTITDISKLQSLYYINIVVEQDILDGNGNSAPEGVSEFTATMGGMTFHGRKHIEKSRNILGQVTASRVALFFDDWTIGSLTNQQQLVFTPQLFRVRYLAVNNVRTGNGVITLPNQFPICTIYHTSSLDWSNNLRINTFALNDVEIEVIRNLYGNYFKSTITALHNDDVIISSTKSTDEKIWLNLNNVDTIHLISPTTTYTIPLNQSSETEKPSSQTTHIYVKNSQTGALLANAHINISASVNGTLHPVINETIPGGIATYTLQPTGGGMPNPDFYRLITTVEGYISVMPYMDFEVDGATTIYDYLDPIAGAPEDENKTFIDFYVRDLTATGISGATVNFGGYTLITNSAGYAVLEVDKNNTYSWIVSKSGYGSLTGNAVIGSDGRHTINTVIAPAVTPTTPTAIPTSTSISPTPTMTAPTGEPVSNWLEWFAAHFGMILGGGAEIGKIFMWLCFSVPVGVYVGKESKAGAAGFVAGAGVVTLFFVLIGWVPIWLLVFIALIIGLLYAKIFNNSDTGGGR